MPLSQDDKDEIRYVVAREIRDFVKGAVNAAINRPTAQGHHMMPGEMQEHMAQRESEQKAVREFGKAILDAAEANLREADARIVEKTDPERADRIRKLVPTF